MVLVKRRDETQWGTVTRLHTIHPTTRRVKQLHNKDIPQPGDPTMRTCGYYPRTTALHPRGDSLTESVVNSQLLGLCDVCNPHVAANVKAENGVGGVEGCAPETHQTGVLILQVT